MEAMMQRVGRGVEVELADDTRRKGFVYTVDPLSHNAVMLVRPDIGAEEGRNWRACMIFKDALKSVSDSHISEIEFVALERDHPLTRQGHDEEQDPVKVAETLEVIKRNLNAHRIAFTIEGESLVILDGIAKLAPPYSKNDIVCRNPVVLERMRKSIFNESDIDE